MTRPLAATLTDAVRHLSRRHIAACCMAGSVCALTAGVGLWAGLGPGLITLGALLMLVALLLGWE